MSDIDRCRDCSEPIRMVRIGTFDGNTRIPLNYSPSEGGQYVIVGPETAAYIKADDRHLDRLRLHADHRRACSGKKAEAAPPLSIEFECVTCGSPFFAELRNGETITPQCAECGSHTFAFVGVGATGA